MHWGIDSSAKSILFSQGIQEQAVSGDLLQNLYLDPHKEKHRLF